MIAASIDTDAAQHSFQLKDLAARLIYRRILSCRSGLSLLNLPAARTGPTWAHEILKQAKSFCLLLILPFQLVTVGHALQLLSLQVLLGVSSDSKTKGHGKRLYI